MSDIYLLPTLSSVRGLHPKKHAFFSGQSPIQVRTAPDVVYFDVLKGTGIYKRDTVLRDIYVCIHLGKTLLQLRKDGGSVVLQLCLC